MNLWNSIALQLLITSVVNCAVLSGDGEVDEQGLYSKSDHVVILTHRNFERRLFGQSHAAIVQFYNSYCGHCRTFAPKFKALAQEILPWKNIIQLKVMDCSVEENNELCREFEVMAYPSLRYIHERYLKGNGNIGDRIQMVDSAEKLKTQIIHKMQTEQAVGHLTFAPKLNIASYATYVSAVKDVPYDTIYTFLVFENENSTVGAELTLDIHDYQHIKAKRAYDTSELATTAGVTHFPGLVAVHSNLEATPLTPKVPSKKNILNAVNTFLQSKNYVFPVRDVEVSFDVEFNKNSGENIISNRVDTVFYSDLEKTLKTSLHTEITRHKYLTGEPLNALLDYLDVLDTSFPFKNDNLKEYLRDLSNMLQTKNQWSGGEIYELVNRLETRHAPVYISPLEYVGCKGTQSKYRGYTCGLWTLFHTLTVNAAQAPGNEGPKVLKAMHGYVKHFFGCTQCSEHFQAMAARNRLFEVKENDKAVLWLWISHNEVNLRLAGDATEDPKYPKIQFPSAIKCPECRLPRGAWNLPVVYQYLLNVYGASNIQTVQAERSVAGAPSPFSNFDIGMLSLLLVASGWIASR